MINVAYNEVIMRNESGNGMCYMSNLIDNKLHPNHIIYSKTKEEIESSFDITFPITITSETPDKILSIIGYLLNGSFDYILGGGNSTNFKNDNLDYFISNNLSFIYPIMLYSNDIFNENFIDFPTKLLTAVKEKKGRIVFVQPTEGFFGEYDFHYKWLFKLSKYYKFDKEDLIMITPNMASKKRQKELIKSGYIIDNFTIYEYSFFQYNHWFIGGHTQNDRVKNFIIDVFDNSLKSNKENLKIKHFLCFNRVPKIHRLVIFSELMSNVNFKDKYITSLASISDFPYLNYGNKENIITNLIEFANNKLEFLEFIKTYDFNNEYTFDEKNLQNNKANTFNIDAHNSTFLNIITESLLHEKNVIFFSEKTFKPIIAAQPFIMVGNPYSIQKLKELGFKTFDRWWDESYDLEKNLSKRLQKIINVMEEIATWDYDRCYQITQEMQETLKHNFSVLLNTQNTKNLMEFLDSNPLPVNSKNVLIQNKKLI